MARKFEPVAGLYAWGPERCEEVSIINAFNEIAPYIPVQNNWLVREYEHNFFERGTGLAFHILKEINDILRRKGRRELNIVETAISDYSREPDGRIRASRRVAIRDELAQMDRDTLAETIRQANLKKMNLPDSHFRYHELQDRNAAIHEANRASRAEDSKRLAAIDAISAASIPSLQEAEPEDERRGGRTTNYGKGRHRVQEIFKQITGPFDCRMIAEKCPDVTRASIYCAIHHFATTGEIKRLGIKRSGLTLYQRSASDTFYPLERIAGPSMEETIMMAVTRDYPGVFTNQQIASGCPLTIIQTGQALMRLVLKGKIERIVKGTYRLPISASPAEVIVEQESPAETPAPPPNVPPSRLIRMLGLATGETRAELLQTLDPDQALDIAETVTDTALRNELIGRAMMAETGNLS